MTTLPEQRLRALRTLDLPRFPRMIVWGKPVSSDQAMDILIRNDEMAIDVLGQQGGNDDAWNQFVHDTLGLSRIKKHCQGYSDEFRFTYAAQKMLMKALKCPMTSYVRTHWISHNSGPGAHGWCHPDGKIAHIDTVGKRPSALDVFEDWTRLAEAFPFLDLTVTMADEPYSEKNLPPFMSIRVKLGKAELLENVVLPEPMPLVRDESGTDARLALMGMDVPASVMFAHERGVDEAFIRAMAAHMAPVVDEVYKRVKKEFPRVSGVGCGISAP